MHKFDSMHVTKVNTYQVETKLKVRCIFQNLNFLGKLRLEMIATHLRCQGQRVSPEHTSCVTISTLKFAELNGIGGREGFNVLGRALHREWSYSCLCFYTFRHSKKTSHLIFFGGDPRHFTKFYQQGQRN